MHILTFKELEWMQLFEPCDRLTPYEIIDWLPQHIAPFHRIMIHHRPRAVGLAAPQVGIFKRFFFTRLDACRRIYINPEWIPAQDSRIEYADENCFSFPGDTIHVGRHSSIEVKWTNLQGFAMGPKVLTGWEARVFQHEHDHLEGKTIFPRTWSGVGTTHRRIP